MCEIKNFWPWEKILLVDNDRQAAEFLIFQKMSFFAIFMPKSFLGPIGKALNTYNWNRILGFVFFADRECV